MTDANIKYNGSLTLDPVLMRAARLQPYERVEVNAVNGKARIVTYILPGVEGSGQVEMNGGAANFFMPGDHVHVNCYAIVEEKEWRGFPYIIETGERNEIIKQS